MSEKATDTVKLRRVLSLPWLVFYGVGVTIGAVHPWRVERVDYPHALVRLNFCKVYDWSGELHMHEGQQFAWQQLPVAVQPVLPGTVPVLAWFAEERAFVGATH